MLVMSVHCDSTRSLTHSQLVTMGYPMHGWKAALKCQCDYSGIFYNVHLQVLVVARSNTCVSDKKFILQLHESLSPFLNKIN